MGMRKPMTALVLAVALGTCAYLQEATKIINQKVDDFWKSKQVKTAKKADDAEFLRRLYLDTVGTVPEADETKSYVANPASDKDKYLIEKIVKTPEFDKFWSERLSNWMLGYSIENQTRKFIDKPAFREWIEEKLKANTPMTEIVKEVISADGNAKEVPQTAYSIVYAFNRNNREQAIADISNQTSRLFLGTRISCAQCHNHPFDKWTQENFYQFAAYYTKTAVKVIKNDDMKKEYEVELQDKPVALPYNPEAFRGKGKILPIFPFDGTEPENRNWRDELAKKIVNNDQFAVAFVNRVWKWMFGKGIVEPVDDFNEKNVPVIPDLLKDLAADFKANNYNLRYLIKSVVSTKVYHISSKKDGVSENAYDTFGIMTLKPLSPEQFVNTVMRVTGVDKFSEAKQKGRIRDFSTEFVSKLLMSDQMDAEAAGSVQLSLTLLNDEIPFYRGTKVNGGGMMDQIMKSGQSLDDRIRTMFLTVFSRQPTGEELAMSFNFMRKAKKESEGLEDLFWVLVNTNEFFFNH